MIILVLVIVLFGLAVVAGFQRTIIGKYRASRAAKYHDMKMELAIELATLRCKNCDRSLVSMYSAADFDK